MQYSVIKPISCRANRRETCVAFQQVYCIAHIFPRSSSPTSFPHPYRHVLQVLTYLPSLTSHLLLLDKSYRISYRFYLIIDICLSYSCSMSSCIQPLHNILYIQLFLPPFLLFPFYVFITCRFFTVRSAQIEGGNKNLTQKGL